MFTLFDKDAGSDSEVLRMCNDCLNISYSYQEIILAYREGYLQRILDEDDIKFESQEQLAQFLNINVMKYASNLLKKLNN
jgi:hypothetical protein